MSSSSSFPVSSGSSSTPVPNSPKFGGLGGPNVDVPWLGGKPKVDFSGSTRVTPRSPLCFVPRDPEKGMKHYKDKTGGQLKKFQRGDATYSLASFADDAKRHMELYGLDTVFYMVDPGTKELVDIFTSHSRFTKSTVTEWIKMCTATSGNANHYNEEYARDMLEQSGLWLYNSLSDNLRTSLRSCLDSRHGNGAGPIIWISLVLEVQSDSYRRYKEVVKELEKLQLSDYKGENISDFVNVVRERCEELERARQLPKDIVLTILNAFCSSSVEEFRGAFIPRRPQIETFLMESEGKDPAVVATLPNAVTFYSLLDDGLYLYRSLVDSNRWGPAKLPQGNAALVQKNRGKPNGGNEKKSTDKTDPTSPDKKIKSEVSPSSTPVDNENAWKTVPPKGNEAKSKAVGKLTWHWCEKCLHWRVNHDTKSHVDKPPKPQGNMALVPTFVDDDSDW